jgi:hypothetical protein
MTRPFQSEDSSQGQEVQVSCLKQKASGLADLVEEAIEEEER